MIFLAAAQELGVEPSRSFVVEDAANGVHRGQGRRDGGARRRAAGRREMLAEADADLVVTTLDDVSVDGLVDGHLRVRRRAGRARHRRQIEQPPSVWSICYDGFDSGAAGPAGSTVHARQRLLRDPRRVPGGAGRMTSITRAPTWPVCTTGWRVRWRPGASRTRTSVNVPNWLPLRSAWRAAPGSISRARGPRAPASSSTCGRAR